MVAYVILLMTLAWKLTSAYMGETPRPIAEAIATASWEKPLYQGDDGGRQTACLMAAIGRYETGYRQIAGDCKGRPPGWPGCGKEAGSQPTSWCFMQIRLVDGEKTAEGWSSNEIMADPLKCARAAREIIRRSIKASPADLPLLNYAGRASAARLRFNLAKRLFSEVPWP